MMKVFKKDMLKFFRFNGFEVIPSALEKLIVAIDSKKWRGVSEESIGCVNANGVSLFINYGYTFLETSIVETHTTQHKKEGSENRPTIKIEINRIIAHDYPDYPISSLRRLYQAIREAISGDIIINDPSTIVVKADAPDYVTTYLKLCDIVFNMRIKSNNDLKRFLCTRTARQKKIKKQR